MAKAGRKCKWEELEIKERYADLSEDFFNFLKEMYYKGDKQDKKWACERLEKAYVKMIPQSVDFDKPLEVNLYTNGQIKNIAKRAVSISEDNGEEGADKLQSSN